MTQTGRRNLTVLSLFGISLIGLILASVLLFYMPATQDLHWRRPIIGSTYAIICVLGVIAVFFPKKCSRIARVSDWKPSPKILHSTSRFDERKTTSLFGFKLTHGHHPDCKSFYGHEFQIWNKTFCAGCTGLLTGALISLVTVPAYFLSQVQLDEAAVPMVGFGFITVLVGLAAPVFMGGRSATRFAINAFLVLGLSSILIGADTLLHSMQIDLYLVALDVLWLMTRISLSQLDHERICANCTRKCIS